MNTLFFKIQNIIPPPNGIILLVALPCAAFISCGVFYNQNCIHNFGSISHSTEVAINLQ